MPHIAVQCTDATHAAARRTLAAMHSSTHMSAWHASHAPATWADAMQCGVLAGQRMSWHRTASPLPCTRPHACLCAGPVKCLPACIPRARPPALQVRTLVINYPLVLNFQEASVARAMQVRAQGGRGRGVRGTGAALCGAFWRAGSSHMPAAPLAGLLTAAACRPSGPTPSLPPSMCPSLQALRQLSSTRPIWAHNFEILSPSQLAFFLRDRISTLLRLEHLVVVGGCKNATLREVMKMSNQAFLRCVCVCVCVPVCWCMPGCVCAYDVVVGRGRCCCEAEVSPPN